jgi:hypothetical protein
VGDLTINTLDDKEGDYLKAKFVIEKEKGQKNLETFLTGQGKGKEEVCNV